MSFAQDIKQWLSWLRSEIGFDGWRFDFVKGYPGRHVMEYIEASGPMTAVGEFWDDCAYTDSKLEYNQVHQGAIVACKMIITYLRSLPCFMYAAMLCMKYNGTCLAFAVPLMDSDIAVSPERAF